MSDIRRGPIDWRALLAERYWHPNYGWCAYHDYDLECPKCGDGMLVFQADSACVFGLVWAECACAFSPEDREHLEADVDQRFRERCLSEP